MTRRGAAVKKSIPMHLFASLENLKNDIANPKMGET
jgi:hypothetical protein